MGFILNSSGVFSRSDVEQLRDQYVALISSDPLSSGSLAVKATSSQGLESVLQDGTVIHVPENTAAIMADCDRLVDIASEPGVYFWKLTTTRSDIRNGAKAPKTTNIFAAFNKIAFAEELPSMEHIFYINLNETDLFALNTPVKVLYNDPLFGRATLTFKMSFSARIINPEAIPGSDADIRHNRLNVSILGRVAAKRNIRSHSDFPLHKSTKITVSP